MAKAIQDMFDRVYADFQHTTKYKSFRKDARLLRKASQNGIAIGGSTGLNLALDCAHKVPSDFDFITDDHGKAWDFLKDYYTGMAGYAHHGKMYIQNKTDWVPTAAYAHYHIESTIHTPFCIMVLPQGTLNAWYNEIGVCIQWSGDIVTAANELTEKDSKPRVKPILDLIDDDFEFEDDFERSDEVAFEFYNGDDPEEELDDWPIDLCDDEEEPLNRHDIDLTRCPSVLKTAKRYRGMD